jgi:multidrug efflux pump subunit AcrA (membrane-fusion protein)
MRLMKMCALLVLSLPGAGPALAQGTPKGTEAFMACARIAGDAERLACYDQAVAALSAEGRRLAAERAAAAEEAAKARAEAEARAAAEAAETARAARVEGFGARGGSPAQREERIDRIEATVTETFTDSQRKLVFLLDNGQMWRQTDGVFLAIVRPGTPVIVRRATMGGFTLRIESLNRNVPVMRMR